VSSPSPAALGRLFLRIGLTAFGGPAAHLAMMHDELVRRRRWLDEQGFLDRMSVANLIPGPNSTEMAILVGATLGGGRGLVLAGAAFIVPAVVAVLALSWAYVAYGATPGAEALLYGVQPAIIAVVLRALVALGRSALTGAGSVLLFGAVLVGYLAGVDEFVLLFGGGVLVMAVRHIGVPRTHAMVAWLSAGWVWAEAAPAVDLGRLFLTFLRIGGLLYGSGYVLLAFLERELVDGLGWLTQEQLLDAVVMGQVTPGPLFSSATFVGYVVAGVPGAAVATAGIFLPSFVLVAVVGPFAARLRASTSTAAFLDGVNVSALALMAGVTLELGRAAIGDVYTFGIALAAGVALIRYDLNSVWIVAGGAALGLVSALW
jgi:chromate transporter